MITIRPLATHEEIFAVEQLQRDAWGVPEVDVVPLHMLITPPRHGGLLLGAFDGDRLAGFVFGFLGLAADGRLKHCSHMAGVHPDYRDHGVGYSLKLAQREHVLAQGLDLITWTFDPLETRNAQLNFHKLGAICNTYIRNLYGAMRAAINAGPPSDRFEVAWWIRSERVEKRLRVGEVPPPSNSPLRGGRAGGASASPFVVPIRCDIPGLPPDDSAAWPADAAQVLLEVPANFQAIKLSDMPLAIQWRLRTRQLFEDAFSQGYIVTDLLRHDDRCYYLLEPASGPSAPN
jgi:predicted GNAT superfamily acetyltransferase